MSVFGLRWLCHDSWPSRRSSRHFHGHIHGSAKIDIVHWSLLSTTFSKSVLIIMSRITSPLPLPQLRWGHCSSQQRQDLGRPTSQFSICRVSRSESYRVDYCDLKVYRSIFRKSGDCPRGDIQRRQAQSSRNSDSIWAYASRFWPAQWKFNRKHIQQGCWRESPQDLHLWMKTSRSFKSWACNFHGEREENEQDGSRGNHYCFESDGQEWQALTRSDLQIWCNHIHIVGQNSRDSLYIINTTIY